MLRLRQVALVTSELTPAEAELCGALDLALCHRDPGLIEFGLHNALFPIGDRFLEIVCPLQGGTTAGRLLDKRGGDGGYMVMFQVDDLHSVRRRLDSEGARVVYVAKGEGITGLHIHPKDMPGAIVSIDEADDAASWPWAGSAWPNQEPSSVASDLVGVTIQVTDPAEASTAWAAALGLRPQDALSTTVEGVRMQVDDAMVWFVPITDERGPGVSAIDVAARDRTRVGESMSAVGLKIRLV